MPKEEGMSKRQTRREQMRRAEQRSRMIFIGLIIVGAILVAFVFIYPNVRPVGTVSTPVALVRPQADDNASGDPNAPIKIEEFSDFQCPFCKRFSDQTEAQLIDTYVATGKVYFVYRSYGNFVSDNSGGLNSESKDAAAAAYCAGDQNKFWEMHDILLANQNGENIGDFTNKRLTAFAETIKLDMGKFQSCFNGNTYSSRVDDDAVAGKAAGIQATPSFVMTYTVNGQVKTTLIEGALPFSDFQTKIEAALAEMGK